MTRWRSESGSSRLAASAVGPLRSSRPQDAIVRTVSTTHNGLPAARPTAAVNPAPAGTPSSARTSAATSSTSSGSSSISSAPPDRQSSTSTASSGPRGFGRNAATSITGTSGHGRKKRSRRSRRTARAALSQRRRRTHTPYRQVAPVPPRAVPMIRRQLRSRSYFRRLPLAAWAARGATSGACQARARHRSERRPHGRAADRYQDVLQ